MTAMPLPFVAGLDRKEVCGPLVLHPLGEPQQNPVVQISDTGMGRRPAPQQWTSSNSLTLRLTTEGSCNCGNQGDLEPWECGNRGTRLGSLLQLDLQRPSTRLVTVTVVCYQGVTCRALGRRLCRGFSTVLHSPQAAFM